MFSPSYYRRCQCTEPVIDDDGTPVLKEDGTPKLAHIGITCPKLGRKGHGTWYFNLELEPGENGKRQRVRRGGFATKEKAEAEAKRIYFEADAGTDVLSDETMGDFLNRWITTKETLARTTQHGYKDHLTNYLIPHLGHIKRRDLRVRHIDRIYQAIKKDNAERTLHQLRVQDLRQARDTAHATWVRASGKTEERRRARTAYLAANQALRDGKRGQRKITSAATMHRINDTLSSALTWGIKRESAFTKNWARLVELPPVTRPKPLVWTPERVAHWRKTGDKPGPVMVWTPELAGQFLDFTADDRLFALWHDFVFLGPRRGEMCALPEHEVNLDALWLHISTQTVDVAYQLYDESPKADSVRTISMSLESAEVNRRWLHHKRRERDTWSGQDAYTDSGRFFTRENGSPLHPDWVSRRFNRLVQLSGLPPVRLHDLRHLSATLALLAKNDIKVVQERLGHASRQITSDTYTSVLPEMMRAEAESTIAVVPRAVTYRVRRPLDVPDDAYQNGVAAIFAHGTRCSGNTWAVVAQARPDTPVLGEIHSTGKGQDHATDASLTWIRNHCADNSLEILKVDNLSTEIPEDQRPDFSLLRFLIARPESPDVSGWNPSQGPDGEPHPKRGSRSSKWSRPRKDSDEAA
ncbi:tyrosine-type recombinase/integrase [Streptomyces fractus]|uniref:tyrosine-type recombinase/integrase n=1 Tax=Streptomyces fractus TaxID=641806 RepID=UPI003CEC11AC